MRQIILIAAVVTGLCYTHPASAQVQIMRGRVVMPDKSVPAQRVNIERTCPPSAPMRETATNKHGEYFLRISNENVNSRARGRMTVPCTIRARMPGYESGTINIEDPLILRDPELPTLVLHAADGKAPAESDLARLPRAALKSWTLGVKALTAQQWPDAERWLLEVTRAAPDFALAWSGLGFVYQSLKKPTEAREAFQRAVKADPAALLPRVQLSRLEIAGRLWTDAAKTAEALIQADKDRRYPEVYYHRGLACYMLHDLDAARSSLTEFLRLDPQHQIPQAEYLLGAVLAGKGDREGAAGALRSYLEHNAFAPNAEAVKKQIVMLTQPSAAPVEALPEPEAVLPEPAESSVTKDGQTLLPGGRKTLAVIAGLKTTPGPEGFLLEYCRVVAAETSRLSEHATPGYSTTLQAYLTAMAELAELGDRRDGRTVITLSLAGADAQQKAGRILGLLGWRVVQQRGVATIEPGDQPYDGPRQRIIPALGLDELALRETLEAGRSFQFEIESERVTLAGGAAWGVALQEFPTLPGGMAEAFVRNSRLARTYAGLAAMGTETAMALARRMGLQTLVTAHADALWLYGDAFRVSSGKAVLPGGVEAEDLWTKLAGTSPRDAARFFEGLLKTDRGRLAAFYSALAHADAAHQSFFTKDLDRAQRFYAWYRDSEELRAGVGRPVRVWRPLLFQNLPLDESGGVRFPGGRQAWSPASTDGEAMFPTQRIGDARVVSAPPPVDFEALLAAVRLERERGTPLDAASAKLLAQNFAEWESLFPYFVALPGLKGAEFQALDALTTAAAGLDRPAQGLVLGEWHSLAALVVLGRKAGLLDDAAAARAFGAACRSAAARDHSVQALAVLREIAGAAPNLDEAVAAGLLQLSGARREGFDRVRKLQNAPRLDSPGVGADPAKTLAALSGVVYGAMLDPDGLLVNEDRLLLAKHVFVTRTAEGRALLFPPASLHASNAAPGSHLAGGFANFQEVVRSLAGAAATAGSLAADKIGRPGAAALSDTGLETVFRADARLVEVHTIVTDERGRYVDDLTTDQFLVHERGRNVAIRAFENRTASLSCALLLDTTLSMEAALPALKSAALKLIGALRPDDSVAVYSLSGGISELQPFTTDKAGATRAVLRAGLGGNTALYDALIRVNRDLAARTGKKVIVVFTDGEDNSSTLTSETAIRRAKTAGVPIYTIAQGHAVRDQGLLKELGGISQATGGLAFHIQFAVQIGPVFENVLQDLMHGYLLAFQPTPAEDHEWRSIRVLLRTGVNRKIRAREGYFPE